MKHKTFLVLDFGSQVTQLIARRLRELNFYSEIHPYNLDIKKIKEMMSNLFAKKYFNIS